MRLYDPLAAAERELWLASNWRAAVLGVSSDNWRAWRDALLARLSLHRRLAPGTVVDAAATAATRLHGGPGQHGARACRRATGRSRWSRRAA